MYRREPLIKNISTYLYNLELYINHTNAMKLYDSNIISEYFFASFLNQFMINEKNEKWQLHNANLLESNFPAVDLIDNTNNIAIQVTSTNDRSKIEYTINKFIEKKLNLQYKQLIILIIGKNRKYYAPFKTDNSFQLKIWDINYLLGRYIVGLSIDDLEKIDIFLKNELKPDIPGSALYTPDNPHYLTKLPDYPTVIYRDEELNQLESLLSQRRALIIINGIGGIGKTALAQKLFYKIERQYASVGWINYNHDLKSSLLSDVRLSHLDSIVDPEIVFSEILSILKSKPTLLFIDNMNQDISYDPLLESLSHLANIKIILTSRLAQIREFHTFSIRELPKDYCVNLFYLYYNGNESHPDKAVVEDIVKRAHYNPLTIQLLASAAIYEDSLESYYNQLLSDGFCTLELKIDELTVQEHLQTLYDITQFKNNESRPDLLRILAYFAIMSPMEIPIQITKRMEANINDLDYLVKQGWINKEPHGFSMHPLIAEILHMDTSIPWEKYTNSIHIFLAIGGNHYINENPIFSD